MALFEIPQRTTKSNDIKIAKKSNSKVKTAPTIIRGGGGILDRINLIKSMVETNLGKYKEEYQVINDKEVLHDFINECIGNGYISIDTETDGLDPLQNTLAGICPYTYGQKGSYIPLNHISYITNTKMANQLDVDFVMNEFKRLLDKKPEIDMFNAKFDIRFLRANGLHNIYCTWDGQLAGRILNENEEHNNLKWLYFKYCDIVHYDEYISLLNSGKSKEARKIVDEYVNRFDDLFDVPFTLIPYNIGYLYAAHDPHITTELCDYQRKWLREDSDREDMRNLYWVFKNIEMPCVDAVSRLEDVGVEFDFEYNEKLKIKYHKILDDKVQAFYETCKPYKEDIDKNDKLEHPINIASTQQLGVLLYDIMGCDLYYDKKKREYTRSTSEDALKHLDNPVAKAILDYRDFATITNTFIDKLPNCVNPNDNRIHCKFNQYGADTGRFSSQEPNLQNIPSHNKDIRKMFKATDGYVLMSADYSQQEIKGMAQMCGDEGMIEAFRQGKDFYAEIASVAFGYPYEECLEFRPDGTTNQEGKERRSQAKSILLGINYGRGATSIAEQLGCSKKQAEQIKEDVFKGFPAIAEFERQSYAMVEDLGYITTLWGRKRRLPSMLLPDYEFKYSKDYTDDILNFDDEEINEVPIDIQDYYRHKLEHCYYKERQKIFDKAKKEGIIIIDNTKLKDYTKVVNARIQGTAADMTKLAMIALNKDERLKELGFRMLIPVHDEIIAECPIENAKECKERFAKIMAEAPGEKFVIPITCDVSVTKCWYGEEIEID